MIILAFALAMIGNTTPKPLTYPETKRDNVVDTLHGVAVPDPYRWLEDDRAPAVEAWVAKQGKLAEEYINKLDSWKGFRSRLEEITNFERVSAPSRRNGLTFFYKNTGNQNHAVMYVQKDGSNDAEVLIDPNTFSKDGTVSLAFAEEDAQAKYLAFGKSSAGSDWSEIYVMEIATRKVLPDTIKWVKNVGISWYNDGFFYSRYDAPENENKAYTEKNSGQYVCYHKVGTPQSQDEIVFRDKSATNTFVGCYVPERSKYLLRWLRYGTKRGGELYIRLVADKKADWKLIFKSEENSFYPAADIDGNLYGSSDEGAPNGKIVRMVNPLQDARMETVVPEGESVIDGLAFGAGRMFVTRQKDVHHEVEMYAYDGTSLGIVELPGKGSVGGFGGFPEDKVLYYTFSSFTYPTTIFTLTPETNTSSVWKKVEAKFNPNDFEAKQVFAVSYDGTKIPMYILHKKGLELKGNAPTILTGYGGFGISYTPAFNSGIIPWLEKGGVYVIANLRGGGEYGEKWHEQGMRLNKQNVFDDAAVCAEWLISNHYTSAKHLGLTGRSNGGLLVGAVINQRPELFGAAVPEVGVMDMLRFHLFTIGWNWQSDYGKVTNEEEFKALYAYSPYHNIKANTEYPPIMVVTADHDDRVVPAHSFKYAAMLQNTYKGNNPMLLRVETKSGHGAVNREKGLDGTADKYAFFWKHLQ